MSWPRDRERLYGGGPQDGVGTSDGTTNRRFPVYLVVGYITASVFLGPTIAAAGVGSIPGGGDDCNPGFALDAAGIARMTAAYKRSQIFMDTGAGVMLAVGLLVLAYLWVRHRHISLAGLVVSTVGILMMMAGYALVIVFAMQG